MGQMEHVLAIIIYKNAKYQIADGMMYVSHGKCRAS